jgi:chemotaxis protein MotB
MNNRYKRLFESEKSEGEFWPSFTDMLAAILLVMLLILTVYIDRVYADYRDQKAAADALKVEADALRIEADALKAEVEKVRGVREELVAELMAVFKKNGLDVSIDDKTGAIQFNSDVLFEYNQDQLSNTFKSQLKSIIPTYFKILYSEKYRDYIAEVIVEGHTDDKGAYLYNLDLSQRRAFNVVSYIISDEFGDFENKKFVIKGITANGRSFSHPIYIKDSKEINDQRSRRVEIKYRFVNITMDED